MRAFCSFPSCANLGHFIKAGLPLAVLSSKTSALFSVFLSVIFCLAFGASAQDSEESLSPDKIFSSLERSLFQIRIIEKKSGSQVALGSGFLVEGNRLATNYHVVSSVVMDAEKYRIEVEVDKTKQSLSVLTADVVNDLALLEFASLPENLPPVFKLAQNIPRKGEVLYSLGNPHDLGMTIVAGNYNGLVDDKFLDRIHFSGAINSGMSGGPTVNRRSEVVGINVASAGNQVGFLVPVKALSALLARARDLPENYRLLEDMANQIGNLTDAMLEEMLKGEWKREEMGQVMILGEVVAWLECWGNSDYDKEALTLEIARGCNNVDTVYVNRDFTTGFFEYEYYYFEAEEWSPPAFYRHWRANTAGARPGNKAGKDNVENYSCVDRIVTTANPDNEKSMRRRLSYCVRPYKELKGLYDVFYMGATVDQDNRAAMDHFTLAGVRADAAQRFLARFVEVMSWR
ncbi:serine protease [Saccharophagus sp. K07]|jgi:serine protease Do|nr:serine protease [Saccharophagus sp. K07]